MMRLNLNLGIALLLIAIALSSCGGGAAKKLEMERDSLRTINESQRQVLDEMTTAIAEISGILDTINQQERILFATHDVEGKRYTRSQVVENLRMFEDLLNDKRKQIHYLDSMMSKSDQRIRQLSSLVNYLNSELSKKDSIIKVLRADVQSKNFNIKNLNERITSISSDVNQLTDSLLTVNKKSENMAGIIKQQEEELYTVYYIIGTKKELNAKGVLSKGKLFKKGEINMDAVHAAEKSDSRELTTITIHGNKPKVLNNIPDDSYSLTEVSSEVYELKIRDVKQFWSGGKLLVIQIR